MLDAVIAVRAVSSGRGAGENLIMATTAASATLVHVTSERRTHSSVPFTAVRSSPP
jgi:hypothetical protein